MAAARGAVSTSRGSEPSALAELRQPGFIQRLDGSDNNDTSRSAQQYRPAAPEFAHRAIDASRLSVAAISAAARLFSK